MFSHQKNSLITVVDYLVLDFSATLLTCLFAVIGCQLAPARPTSIHVPAAAASRSPGPATWTMIAATALTSQTPAVSHLDRRLAAVQHAVKLE